MIAGGKRRWAWAAAAAVALVACDDAPRATGPPNIVLITLDTTRADHLGTYGYFRDTSPAIDRLASEAIVFEHGLAPMATTLPTHVSIMTATYPPEHGVLANVTQGGERFVPSASLRSFAATARGAGYRTGAFVSATPLKVGSGIESGFEAFSQPRGKQRRAGETIDEAIGWLASLESRPFFLFVHLYDPHWPYEPPAPYDRLYATDAELERHLADRSGGRADAWPARCPRPLTGSIDDTRAMINAYDGEIRYLDSQLERLFDWLRSRREWERSALLLMGDHGEGLCQHGEAAHGGTWNEQLRIPFLLRVPGEPPRRIARAVSAVDAFPTLLARIDAPGLAPFLEHASGRDALAADAVRPILSQDTGRERDVPYRHALHLGRWKYFRVEHRDGAPTGQLYDLASDPHELHELSAQRPEVAERMVGALSRELERLESRGASLRSGAEPRRRAADPELLEELRALGYLETPGQEAQGRPAP